METGCKIFVTFLEPKSGLKTVPFELGLPVLHHETSAPVLFRCLFSQTVTQSAALHLAHLWTLPWAFARSTYFYRVSSILCSMTFTFLIRQCSAKSPKAGIFWGSQGLPTDVQAIPGTFRTLVGHYSARHIRIARWRWEQESRSATECSQASISLP